MSQVFADVKFTENQLSIEIPNSGGARKSSFAATGDTISFAYENLKTTWDAMKKGQKISGNGPCVGRRTQNSNYSWLTYNEIIKRAENFGSGLIKIGLSPGQSTNIAIYAQNSVEWVVAQYGIWSQSAVLIPLYDSLGPDASIFMISHAEIEVAICDHEKKVKHLLSRKSEIPKLDHIVTMSEVSHEIKNLAKETGVRLHSFTEIEQSGEINSTPLLSPQTSDIAIICYTSGTTGDPKGVMLTHENIMSTCTTTHLMMGNATTSKEDIMISYLPMAHLFEQIVQLWMFMVGGCIGFFSGDVCHLADDMKVLQPTVFPAVPRLLNRFYDKAQAMNLSPSELDIKVDPFAVETDLKEAYKPFIDSLGGRIRLIISGGAPIYKEVLEFYSKVLRWKILEAYGQTECSGPCTCVVIDSYYNGNVGSPIPCCIVKLVDVPEMEYFSENSKGEVCVKGSGVFKGYLKDPKKTAEALDSDGWLHTGDIGMWLPDGTLKIIDRKKNVLKLAQGLYVALEKIEFTYALSPFVSQIFVHGDGLKSVLIAIVVPEKEILLQWCEQNLNKFDLWTDICKDSSVRKMILEDIWRVGKEAGLNSYEQVKGLHLHPDVLTYEQGFLTLTSKLKREACKKHFAKEITEIIDGL